MFNIKISLEMFTEGQNWVGACSTSQLLLLQSTQRCSILARKLLPCGFDLPWDHESSTDTHIHLCPSPTPSQLRTTHGDRYFVFRPWNPLFILNIFFQAMDPLQVLFSFPRPYNGISVAFILEVEPPNLHACTCTL